MPSYDYDDYHSIAEDADELYTCDDEQWDNDSVEINDTKEWENYYHNIADELVED